MLTLRDQVVQAIVIELGQQGVDPIHTAIQSLATAVIEAMGVMELSHDEYPIEGDEVVILYLDVVCHGTMCKYNNHVLIREDKILLSDEYDLISIYKRDGKIVLTQPEV